LAANASADKIQIRLGGNEMPKAYWISFYSSAPDQAKLDAYSALARPALKAGGGRVLARGKAAAAFEKGMEERVVLIEFDSVEQALAARASEGYQAALRALGIEPDRDMRIVEGLE
jgi:uncharacterized protein (DUF1330 family)